MVDVIAVLLEIVGDEMVAVIAVLLVIVGDVQPAY